MSDANTSLKLNKTLITQIDAARGELSRQAFIKAILTNHFTGANSENDANTNNKAK